MNLDRRDAELLFQVLTERDEKLSIAIAWIGSFSGWTKALAYPPALHESIDRLTFNGTIIESGTESPWLDHSRARQQASLARDALRPRPNHLALVGF